MELSRATFAAAAMKRSELEQLAERYLKYMYPRNLVIPTRLNVIEMLDRLEDDFGIIFGVEELDHGEEGLTDPVKNQILLAPHVYDALVAGDGRARQTACHEIGHIQHIRQIQDIIRDGIPQLARRLNVAVPIYRNPEWQAHGVGSALLMPRTTVPKIYQDGGIRAVAEFFQVSYQNATVRTDVLRRLKVL